jgi:hypothetical protein
MPDNESKSPDDEPWFRRFRADGRMEPLVARGDNGEILILDEGWAASLKNGVWQEGIAFSHDQIAEFSPVQKREEIYRLLEEAKAALDAK